MRPASLGAGARKPLAAEGLRPDNGADLVAVDIGVADPHPRQDALDRSPDAAVNAQRQPVAGRVDRLADLVEADVVAPRGTVLLRQLLADLRTLHRLAQPFVQGLDLTGQPYNFDLDTFVCRNPQLLVGDRP